MAEGERKRLPNRSALCAFKRKKRKLGGERGYSPLCMIGRLRQNLGVNVNSGSYVIRFLFGSSAFFFCEGELCTFLSDLDLYYADIELIYVIFWRRIW